MDGMPLPGMPWVESPLFDQSFGPGMADAETSRVALSLHRHGVAVVDVPGGAAAMAELAGHCGGGARVAGAWSKSQAALGLALDAGLLGLLGRLYGRAAFAFESEAVAGGAGPVRSEAVVYGSLPGRFYCAVQVALEDGAALDYHRGSHAWPVLDGAALGHSYAKWLKPAPDAYEAAWTALLEGRRAERLVLRCGQAVIRAANLLHAPVPGGWWLQTRYHFRECAYYTPCESEPVAGLVSYRHPVDIGTGAIVRNRYAGRDIPDEVETIGNPHSGFHGWVNKVPRDFDAAGYLRLNPDVAVAGVDPEEHYIQFGIKESRGYRD